MTAKTAIELTDAIIRDASCPLGLAQLYLRDAEQRGLAVRLRPSGAKTFYFEFTRPGVKGTARDRIGPFPKIKVKDARKAAAILAGEHAKGTDLVEQKRAAKQAARAEAKRATLGELVKEGGPYEQSLIARQVVNTATALSALRRHLLPLHRSTDVRQLTRRDITAPMDKLATAGKLGAAQDLRKHCSTFLNWAVTQGHADFNPLAGMRQPKATRAERLERKRRGRILSDDEIRKLWGAAGKMGAFGLLTRLALLGGARRSEPAQIEWSRHVLEDRVCFDDARTKMGRGYFVPRTALVDSVLEDAKRFERATSPLVFPGQRGTPISGFTRLVGRLIKQAAVQKFTMHDLRRTARSILARLGWDDDIQRLCVGQKPRGIDAVYNLDEQAQIRALCFGAYHDYLTALLEGQRTDNVVRLSRTDNPRNKLKAELLDRLRAHHGQVDG